jgi:hypothetical protein
LALNGTYIVYTYAKLLIVLYTAYTMSIAEQSLLSFGYQLMISSDTAQVVIDLYIMAILAIVWMYYDVK